MSQQRQQEREREQRDHTLPESDGGTFIERLRPAHCVRGARRSRLHLPRKFCHVAKALDRIDCDRSPEYCLEPCGEVRAQGGERRRALERLRIEERTIILYEAPHRVAECVAEALEILGERPACLAREVTKLHEEFVRGKLSEIATALEERPARGEITLILGPSDTSEGQAQGNSAQSLAARVEELMHQAKLDRKEALKLAAKERGLTRRAAYHQIVGGRSNEVHSGEES